MLQTPRLLLRRLAEADFPALMRVWGDPETLVHYPRVLGEREVLDLIQRHRAQHDATGWGLQAVVLKDGGEVIGDCGVSAQRLGEENVLELGYHLAREHWGRGYATEAARAALADARARGAGRIISLILPQNEPSRRVAERLGARVEGETQWAGLTHLVYVHQAPGAGSAPGA